MGMGFAAHDVIISMSLTFFVSPTAFNHKQCQTLETEGLLRHNTYPAAGYCTLPTYVIPRP
jgi:hypothetical protein